MQAAGSDRLRRAPRRSPASRSRPSTSRNQISRTVRPLAPKPSRPSSASFPSATPRLGAAYAGLRPGAALALRWSSVRTRALLIEGSVSYGREKSTKPTPPAACARWRPAKTPSSSRRDGEPAQRRYRKWRTHGPIALRLAEGVCATNACYRAATSCPDRSRSCVTGSPRRVEFRQCDESRALP